jgi:hypothetical protein
MKLPPPPYPLPGATPITLIPAKPGYRILIVSLDPLRYEYWLQILPRNRPFSLA